MPRPILVGKQRRITISEFSALCNSAIVVVDGDDAAVQEEEDHSVFLQMMDPPSSDDNDDNAMLTLLYEQFERLVVQNEIKEDKLTTCDDAVAVVGTLTLLAFAIAQERIYPDSKVSQQATFKLTHIVNSLVSLPSKDNAPKMVAPTSTSTLFQNLISIGVLPPDNTEFVENKILPKCVNTTKIILATHAIHELTVTSSVDLCVAALSVQRLKQPANPIFHSTWYDTLTRPHRSSIHVAAIMRVLLEGSKYTINTTNTTTSSSTNALLLAVEQIPTTHGIARDIIASAYKTLEKELNSVDDPRGLDVQITTQNVTMLTVNLLCTIIQELITTTQMRVLCQEASTATTVTSILADDLDLIARYQSIVDLYMNTIMGEMNLGLQFVHQERVLAIEEFNQKEALKAARAADFAASSSNASNNANNEFDGMTEAQISKIVKKRAQKALKQQTSKAASPTAEIDILTTLFGVGTSSVIKLLESNTKHTNNISSSSRVVLGQNTKQFEILVERLQRGGVQRKPKIPKGTRDFLPEQMMIRDQAFQIIRRVFKRHGAVEIDTPVFELKETLTGKYGEDSKLIYDLADQGGELLSLRYDLTVPFARFLSLHKNEVGNIKRFHIGKVYRRDQPALARGRYREFYQCDFDIAGQYGRMIPDAECLAVAAEILGGLPIGCDFCIKVNHRRLLDSILDLCGVPSDKFRTICSAVDKLDKETWDEVKREMVQDKGLESSVADKIGTFVLQKGEPWAMYNQLIESGMFASHEGAQEALEDMRILFDYLDAMGKLVKISFDMSLARGLDYYTGVIYEAVCIGSGNTQMGSIGGGGRYDNLVAMFQEAGKITPCVGVSIGIERVFTLMEAHIRDTQGGTIKQANVTVLVASVGDKMIKERMKVAKMLWDANISAEYTQQEQPKLNKEITNALDRGIPFMAIIGEEELKEQKCKIKDLRAHEEELVSMDEVVATLLRRGAVPVGCELAFGKI